MQTILGKLNGTYLHNCLALSYPASKSIVAAVAYAEFHDPLVDHLRRYPDVKLKFYGRMDHTGAVSLRLLEWFLKEAPATAECFLVNGAFHPTVELIRSPGQVRKHYAVSDSRSQASKEVGVS